MTEPELAYMTGTNDDFDLPRWQTQAHLEPLSSSAQAAQSAAQAPYHYQAAPPPPPPHITNSSQRLPPLSPGGTSRGPRISQILEQDPNSSYLSTGQSQLSRSASLGGNTTSSSRARRHHQPEDLEGAFHSESPVNSRPPPASNSFYPASVAYHQQTNSSVNNGSSPAGDSYSDMYFNQGPGHAPKRSQTTQEPVASTHTGRSPLPANAPLLDPYSQQQQSPYSPSSGSYPYGPPTENQRPPYPSHSRSHSNIKAEAMTPPVSPYSPMQQQSSTPGYSSSYTMGSASPNPLSQHQSHLAPHPPNRQNSASTPTTPLSFAYPSQSPPGPYYPKEEQMVVEVPQQHKRRASGFRRVRNAHDLRPHVNPQPPGRRMDSSGVFLSVGLVDFHGPGCAN
jgi:dual specificity protein kinase YAK1